MLQNKGVGANGGVRLIDEIVTKASKGGVLIGYDALDGKIPGCYSYDSYVTIRVKAIFDTRYEINQQVRLVDAETNWSNSVEAKIGDVVEFMFTYKNTTETETQTNVTINYSFSNSIKYIPNTIQLKNKTFPTGTVINFEDVIAGTDINIGDYEPGTEASVCLKAKVIDNGLNYGINNVGCQTLCSVGSIAIKAYATVKVTKKIETKFELS